MLVFLETTLVLVTLGTNPMLTMTLAKNTVLMLFLETFCVLELIFQRDDETFFGVRKDDVTFLDVQTDGVTLLVPGSRSSFSVGSVVVVGPRENQCRDAKLGSGGEAEHNMSEPLVNSPEAKRQMVIAITSGASVRTSYKTVRKRVPIEARRQKEIGWEVVPDSFLNQVKVEQHPQSGSLKRVLTPAAKAAKHRRARDKKLRVTLCCWIANDKVCPKGDLCNFRHAVTEEKEKTMSGTGASCPGPATEQNDSGTGVLSSGPSLRQKNVQKVQHVTAGTRQS